MKEKMKPGNGPVHTLQLKDAEINRLSRELEIETALEKVRAVAMGMKEPADMLTVCKMISLQMQSLGIKEIRNVQTAIFYDSKGTYMNYEYYAKHKKTVITETNYTNHKMHKAFAKKMMQGKGEFFSTHIKEKKVKEWLAYQKTTNVFIDRYLEKASSLNYYWHSLGPVALGISTYMPLRKDDLNLFNRFLNVFELAYTRYLDIEQAIAQAREARIEASLEKVRAQALGMRKAEDLPNVCEVLFKELQALGFPELRNAMVNIHDDEKRTFVNYDYSDEIGKSITPLFYDIHPVIKKQIKQIRSADDAFSETVFKGKDLESWKAFRKSRGEKQDKRIKNSTALYYYFYSIGTGSIGISTFKAIPGEKQELLKRFRNVFAFAYRRYMDVAQAEAQAYEAKIEASLERVRAQAMGIRKPEELAGVGEIIFTELKSLGFTDIRNTEIIVNKDETNRVTSYYYSDYGVTGTIDMETTHPTIKQWIADLKKTNDSFVAVHIPEKKMKEWRKYRESLGYLPDHKLNKVKTVEYYSYSIGLGALSVSSFKPITEEQLKTLERFKNVFGLAYRRYADVAQAEAQAHEAKIELGLERVRARAMAMQNSDELAGLVSVLFKELTQLDFALTSCIIWISDTQTLANTLWVTSAEMNKPAEPVRLKPFQHSFFHSILHAWKEKDPKWIYTLTGKEKTGFEKTFFANEPGMPVALKKALSVPMKVVFSASFNNFGALEILGTEPLTDEKFEILHRFGKVFDSSYTRFNDLKKAEAQAREAQIELGLERVRARAMAMQKSDELSELVDTVFKELTKLDFALTWCIINVIDESTMSNTVWAANPDINKAPESYHMLFEDYPFHDAMMKGWKERKTKHVYVLEGQEKKVYDEYLFNETEFRRVPAKAQAASRAMDKYVVTFSFSNFGGLQTVGDVPLSDANLDILSRFGKVFDLTYTRFNDLKLAEAQAREAQIETALERVRSRTMGMQKSEELKEVIQVVYEQFVHLNIKVEHSGFVIDYKERDDYNIWIADPLGIPSQVIIPYFDSVYYNRFNEAKEKGEDFFATNLSFEEKNRFYKKLFEYVPGLTEEAKGFYFNCPGLAASTVLLENVCLYIENFSGIPYTDEENATLMRFGKVFQQTYTRFLDLQKAEVQAREAKIEAALERTRTQSMIMQHSDELNDISKVFHQQLLDLHIETEFSYLWLPDEPNGKHLFWATWAEDENDEIIYFSKAINYDLDKTEPATATCFSDWESGVPVHVYTLGPAETITYFETWKELLSGAKKLKSEFFPEGIYYAEAFMKYGCFGIMIHRKITGEEQDILRRFAIEFERTYTRFLDLQKAEAQAREAQIEAALERVRSRTMAMQKSDELAETAAVLFRQLINLGIEPNRLYIFILKEENTEMEAWITDEDGTKVSKQFLADASQNESTKKMYDGWKEKRKSLTIDMQGKELENYFHYLANELKVPFKGGLSQKRRVQSMAFFSKGIIGIASPEPQLHETIQLLERFAGVFNLTFTRFNDLKIAEAHADQAELDLLKLKEEKKRTEDALAELQVTQKQLIQAEKMASLGELTAGIAHEIQNPLNFVNNFSEVNKELLTEMNEEIQKGNYDEVKAIAKDVTENEEKIIFHGKRADAIVKGMLQHSRSSSGVKEPTDINALADEYLRLAYHGLRAKDKSFNATMKTDFDETIGNINIIPQDIGRVILNLITNAFYAAPLPPEGGFPDPDYKHSPTVWVSTKKLGDKIQVSVRDNGPGIPQKIMDKIFQPFFTTKPTGQGTGLGLSLSYDIIKAHGGEIKVNTKENEGTEFIILLPVA